MRSILSLCVLLFLGTFALGQEITFVLKGQIFNSKSESLLFQQNDGQKNNLVAKIAMDEKGFFEEKIKVKEKDYYVLALEDGQSINIIVNAPDTIKVYADGRNLFYNSNIIGADESTKMIEYLRVHSQYKRKLDSAQARLEAETSKAKQRIIQQEFQPIHQAFLKQRQSFIISNPMSPALIAVTSSMNIENDLQDYKKIVQQLELGFGESPTVQRLASFFNAKEKEILATSIVPGAVAQDIALPNPEGDTLRLSDYKGKVVLLDFWASWCGPCRRENPNVVNAYKEFKDKGFEVFSVSLDRAKDKWVEAIEKDELLWDGHVSDLKFWQSEAAQKYKVNSIPFAVLIDQEGKIIDTNLRGEALTRKLAEILN